MAVLFSTFTYAAYAQNPRGNFDAAYIERRNNWHAYPYHPAEYPEFGLSLYDLHADGSGVMFSSTLRPQLLMRPGYFAYVDERGSGLRHFPADMHLISWCAAKDIKDHVITDHDLEAEGNKALEAYALVLTVTHPEYHTARTLDTIESFVNGGGSLGYLGGNGFYWRIATNEALPNAIELRRGETGARSWEAEPGEYFHAFDGCYGGLWLKNDRPPQRLVGVGMSAHGDFTGSFYRRTDASYDPQFAWLFNGIDDEILGDFGFSGGGCRVRSRHCRHVLRHTARCGCPRAIQGIFGRVPLRSGKDSLAATACLAVVTDQSRSLFHSEGAREFCLLYWFDFVLRKPACERLQEQHLETVGERGAGLPLRAIYTDHQHSTLESPCLGIGFPCRL
ncbi:hypothetical protein NKH81_33925 [Mesorhizobium sp. M0959]